MQTCRTDRVADNTTRLQVVLALKQTKGLSADAAASLKFGEALLTDATSWVQKIAFLLKM